MFQGLLDADYFVPRNHPPTAMAKWKNNTMILLSGCVLSSKG